MNRKMAERSMRLFGCAVLLALLAASSYAAVRPVRVASVPIMAQTVSGEAMTAASMEETRARLEQQRAEALALLQSVIDDPRAERAQVSAALEKKTQIAGYMEKEASIQAVLVQMGLGDAAVVMGENALSIIAPWQTAENEQNRTRMIDAAVSHSAMPAEAVKIILSKK